MEDSSLSSSTTDTVQSEAAPVPQEAVQKEDSSVGSTSPSRTGQFTVTNSLLSTTILPEDEGGCLMFDVPAGSTVISEDDFQKLLADVTAASDDEARIQTVKEGKEGHLFSSQQIVELLATTSCVKTRQAMVQSLGPRVKDLGESKAVLDVFENPADRAEAEAVFRQVAKMAITTGSMSPRSRSPKQVLQGKGGGARGNPLARTTGSPAGRPVSSSPALPHSPATTADTTVPDEAAGTAGAASSVQEEQESVDGSSVGGLTAVSMEPVAPLLQSPLDTSVASSTTTSEEDTSSGTSPFAATEAGNSSTAVAVEGEEGNSNAALVGSSFATSLSSSYDSLGSLSTIESTASLYQQQQQQPPRARMPNALPPQPSPLKHQVLPEGEEVTPLPPASSDEPAPKQEEKEAEDAKKPAAEQVQQQEEEEEAEPEAAVTLAEPAAVAEPEEEEAAGQPAVPAEKQPEKVEEEAAATTTAAEPEVAKEEEAEKEQAAVASKEEGEEAPQQEGAPRKSVMARFAGGVTPFGGPSSAPPPMPKPLGKQPPPPKKPLVDTVGGGNVVPPPVPALASTTTAAKTQVVGPDELVPYEELVERKREGRLDGLNPAALEDYVNDQDFATVFKMSRQEFQQLPKWKQKRAKQDAGLF